MTLLSGNVTTNVPVRGQDVDLNVRFRYPTENASEYDGVEQPLTPPVELSLVNARVTDDKTCLIDPNDETIKWFDILKSTPDTTCSYNETSEEWEGVEDSINIYGVPVKNNWYYQVRVCTRLGVWSDYTDVFNIIDQPAALPVPEFVSVKTNDKDQVILEWTDLSGSFNGFAGYQLVKIEEDTSARLETDAKIISSS